MSFNSINKLLIEAELFYKSGEYIKCIDVAMSAHEVAKKDAIDDFNSTAGTKNEFLANSTVWDSTRQEYVSMKEYIEKHNPMDDVVPAPLKMAGKAYRALGKKAKKEKQYLEASNYFKSIIDIGVATDSDKKIYNSLK